MIDSTYVLSLVRHGLFQFCISAMVVSQFLASVLEYACPVRASNKIRDWGLLDSEALSMELKQE